MFEALICGFLLSSSPRKLMHQDEYTQSLHVMSVMNIQPSVLRKAEHFLERATVRLFCTLETLA